MIRVLRWLLSVLPRDRLGPEAKGPLRDGLIVAVAASWTFAVAAFFDLFDLVVDWARNHRDWHIGELIVACIVCGVVLGALFAYRGWQLRLEMHKRRRSDLALREAHARLSTWVGELEQRDYHNALLNETADLLQACLTPEELAAVTSRSVPRLFPGLSGGLFALGAARDVLEPIAHWGENPPAGDPFSPAECWAFRRGKPHLGGDAASGPQCKHVGRPSPSAYLCVPLVAQGDLVGVLHLCPDRDAAPDGVAPFTEARRLSAQMVGERIALQLANLRLRQTLRDQAIRDPLTGLYNRRYLEETLERELHRCARTGKPLVAIMVDIDRFKRFNDVYGHATGDAIVSALGTYLMAHVRREDIACRYGGDEFAIIMPDAGLESAVTRAEELRLGLKGIDVTGRDRHLGGVSASFGVAVFPAHGDTAERLLRAADLALYQAKAAGRDRVAAALSSESTPWESTTALDGEAQPTVVSLTGPRPFKSRARNAAPDQR